MEKVANGSIAVSFSEEMEQELEAAREEAIMKSKEAYNSATIARLEKE